MTKPLQARRYSEAQLERGPTDTVEAVQMLAQITRDAGHKIKGCSFCATHSPKPGKGDQNCPFCGRVVKPATTPRLADSLLARQVARRKRKRAAKKRGARK